MSRKKFGCIYKISFKNTKLVYIGSTTRWLKRQQEHIRQLKHKKHFNQYLQRFYDRHQSEPIFTVLEWCEDQEELIKKENDYIQEYKSTNNEFGFNLVKIVQKGGTKGYRYTDEQKKSLSNSARKRMENNHEREKISKAVQEKIKSSPNAFGGAFVPKKYILINPQGEEVSVYNLCKFCRENNLLYSKMYRMAVGLKISYKGWTTKGRKNKKVKIFEFLNPENKYVKIINLLKFCKKHNLPYRTMLNVHKGIGISCRGWRSWNNGVKKHRKGKTFQIVNSDGEVFLINNLKLFCQDHGCSYGSIRKGFCSNGFRLK